MSKLEIPNDFDIKSIVDWHEFYCTYNVTSEFIQKNYKKIIKHDGLYAIIQNCKPLDESILEMIVQDKNNVPSYIWDHLCVYQDISQEFIEKHIDNPKSHKINLRGYVASHVKISTDFILKYKDQINVSQLAYNRKIELPLDFFYEHFKEIDMRDLRGRQEYIRIELTVKRIKFECLKDKHGNIAFLSNYKHVILFCSKDEEEVKKFISSKIKKKIETFDDWAIRLDKESLSHLLDYIGSGYRTIKEYNKKGKLSKFFRKLQKIPSSSGKFYRGLKFNYHNSKDREKFKEVHTEGNIIEIDCITSVSKHEGIARDFKNNYGYILEIDARDVKMIDELNKSEAEGFLLKGIKLKVKKVDDDSGRVYLEQV